MQDGMIVAPETLVASRLKIFLYLTIVTAALAWTVFAATHPAKGESGALSWLFCLFWGSGVGILAWNFVRPSTLLLDAQGFTLKGSLIRTPRRVAWADIESFFVFRMRLQSMAAYNFVDGKKPTSLIGKASQAMGADAALPMGWRLSTKQTVDKLQSYRARALGIERDRAP